MRKSAAVIPDVSPGSGEAPETRQVCSLGQTGTDSGCVVPCLPKDSGIQLRLLPRRIGVS